MYVFFSFVSHTRPNLIQPVWKCPKGRYDSSQCGFFIWVDDEEKAKKSLRRNPPPDPPETPRKIAELGDPWSKSKSSSKRKPVSRENSDGNEHGRPSDWRSDAANGEEEEDCIGDESPSKRKSVKSSRFAGPSGNPQAFTERLKEAMSSASTFPLTPSKKGKEKAVEGSQISPSQSGLEESPILIQDRGTEIMENILSVLAAEKCELKDSTKSQIREEIELAMLRNRVEELEAEVLRSKGDGSDQPIELD
jgi:hypothetical protein